MSSNNLPNEKTTETKAKTTITAKPLEKRIFYTLCGDWSDAKGVRKEITSIIDTVELDGEKFVLHEDKFAVLGGLRYCLTHYASGLYVMKSNSKKMPLKKLKEFVSNKGGMEKIVAQAKSAVKSLKINYPINKNSNA